MEKDDDIKDKLNELTDIIKMVYLPLMDGKPDTRLQMEKFVKQVGISLQQAYGNITIQVPELPDAKEEEICNNKDLVEELINTVVSLVAMGYALAAVGSCGRVPGVFPGDLPTDPLDRAKPPILNFQILNKYSYLNSFRNNGPSPSKRLSRERTREPRTRRQLKARLSTGARELPPSTLSISSSTCTP